MRLGTIAFLAGIVAGLHFTGLPPLTWLILSFPLLLILLRFPRLRVLALFALGTLWLLFRASLLLSGTLATELEGKDAIIEGSIVSIPVVKEKSTQFMFAIDTMRVAGEDISGPRKLRLSWYGKQTEILKSGQRWRMTVRLKRPYGLMNPGGFDYEAWLLQNGVNATGYVRNISDAVLIEESIWGSFYRLRQGLATKLGELTKDYSQQGILLALALGERNRISHDQWQRLLDTGTNHLVAISGLHIGLVAAWLYFLTRWLWLRALNRFFSWPASTVAAVISLIGAFFYAALAGFALPTQRALIMLVVAMLALVSRRPLALSSIWALSLFAVLIYDPLAPLSAGFWLSFAAVGIIIFTFNNRLAIKSIWWKVGRIHLLIALGLVPLLVIHFQHIPLFSPLANFIAVPLVSLITVPLTLLSLLFISWLPVVSDYLLFAANASVVVLDRFLFYIHSYSELSISASLNSFVIASMVLGTVYLLMPRGWPARWLGVIGFLPLFFTDHLRPSNGHIWLSVLDVGQGLAVVVQTHNHVLLYDAGAKYSQRFDMGSAVIIPFLQSRGVNYLNTMVISHADNDHSGGAEAVQELLQVDRILTSLPNELRGIDVDRCQVGQTWHWDGVDFEMLHPDDSFRVKQKRKVRNNFSCVLRISNGVETILLTGDIEYRAEQYLLSREKGRLAADILLAPHHGSATSSSKNFVNEINAQYVVFPVGYRNTWGFPKDIVLKRYEETGAIVFRSDQSGALQFILDGDGDIGLPSQYRLDNKRFWHAVN